MPLSCEPPGLRQCPSASAGVHCNTPEFGLPGLPSATWFSARSCVLWSVGFTAQQLIRLPSLDSSPTPEPSPPARSVPFRRQTPGDDKFVPHESCLPPPQRSVQHVHMMCTNVRFHSSGSQSESRHIWRTRTLDAVHLLHCMCI